MNHDVEQKGRVMGRGRRGKERKSYTLPPSPSHSFSSSSSSDFEFTISISPLKSSTALCPADELFYKGQLLPLHLSPRISMVRTLLLSSSSTSSSSSTAPRDSTGSSSNDSNSSFNTTDLSLFPPECDSSRPSSVTEDDEFKRLHSNPFSSNNHPQTNNNNRSQLKKSTHKYFSLSRFSAVFRKDNGKGENVAGSSVKRMSATAKEVIRKYLKKVKPLYEKLSQKQQQTVLAKTERSGKESTEGDSSGKSGRKENYAGVLSHSFSGNLRYPRRRSCVSSCPSSMRSSPSHSGVLSQRGVLLGAGAGAGAGGMYNHGSGTSSMEELQSAIQGAIAHCKNSLIQNNKTVVSNQINLI